MVRQKSVAPEKDYCLSLSSENGPGQAALRLLLVVGCRQNAAQHETVSAETKLGSIEERLEMQGESRILTCCLWYVDGWGWIGGVVRVGQVDEQKTERKVKRLSRLASWLPLLTNKEPLASEI